MLIRVNCMMEKAKHTWEQDCSELVTRPRILLQQGQYGDQRCVFTSWPADKIKTWHGGGERWGWQIQTYYYGFSYIRHTREGARTPRDSARLFVPPPPSPHHRTLMSDCSSRPKEPGHPVVAFLAFMASWPITADAAWPARSDLPGPSRPNSMAIQQ